jgi:hypothetical protein
MYHKQSTPKLEEKISISVINIEADMKFRIWLHVRTWFTVQHHALWRPDADLFVELWVSERQLHSFFDLLDLFMFMTVKE